MTYNKKVQFIPARPPKRERPVAIYSRVSSNSLEQLNSLTAQISALTRMVASVPEWLLVDTYVTKGDVPNLSRPFVTLCHRHPGCHQDR